MENPKEPCHVCGDIGVEDLIMTCFNCRQVKEHIYCAAVCLRSVPDMWLCQVCRSSTGVLQTSDHVDNSSDSVKKENSMPVLHHSTSNSGSRLHFLSHGLRLLAQSCPDDKASLVSSDISPSKKQRLQFLAFPSPKRKRRTLRLEEDIDETKRQRPQSSHP